MAQGNRRATYNTLIARKLLDKHLPENLREELPPPPPEAPTTDAGHCFRRVAFILSGKERKERQLGFQAAATLAGRQ